MKPKSPILVRVLYIACIVIYGVAFSQTVYAKTPVIKIRIKNHLFYPSEVLVPANKKVKLLIINEDETPEEFESYELNREKIITGKGKGVVFIGPLSPGRYPFFGEFYPRTAQGVVVAE